MSPALQVDSLPTELSALGREDPLEKGMATHSSILAWKSNGQRSLAGYSPWSCKESDTTERLNMHKCQETGVLGDFWGRIKGAKYRFAFQDGTWDIF